MKPFLLALALLSSVTRSADGDRITLTFDAPVTVTQTLSAAPARMVLEVSSVQVPAPAAAQAAEAGLSLAPGEVPGTTRFTLPLPPGRSATVASSPSEIRIELREEPLLIAATPVETAPQGGIPDAAGGPGEGDASPQYVIGPEDLIEINVFELPELKTETRVLGDGTISLPLLGVVKAAGLTRTGLETRLRDLLEARFLLNPQVTIAVTEHMSRVVSVIGAVNKPGTYQMIGPRSLMQMISEAGGLSKEAGETIIILRRAGDGTDRMSIDLDELALKGNPELNVALAPGDVVNVPVDRPVYVFVDGAVKLPGQVEGKLSRPVTLLQAVARTGGLTERANLRGAHVLRKQPDGTQKRIPVNLRDIRKGKADDLVLEDGDVVVIPETFF
ncbi:MAG TPA: polysaccharide biosynthesis/export family protein [Candidatus Polarisedimenticolia bacterium]|nr:polysaccharide biosynthesis/export family protein [Candidatus Polarisedimenticolia bacterium]